MGVLTGLPVMESPSSMIRVLDWPDTQTAPTTRTSLEIKEALTMVTAIFEVVRVSRVASKLRLRENYGPRIPRVRRL